MTLQTSAYPSQCWLFLLLSENIFKLPHVFISTVYVCTIEWCMGKINNSISMRLVFSRYLVEASAEA
jgi:hypothetical protein